MNDGIPGEAEHKRHVHAGRIFMARSASRFRHFPMKARNSTANRPLQRFQAQENRNGARRNSGDFVHAGSTAPDHPLGNRLVAVGQAAFLSQAQAA
jgi:hypothetical protein